MHYPDLLTARQLASQLGVNHDTLRRWRRQGDGPPWINLAPHRARPVVRYRQSEVDAWLRACRAGSVDPEGIDHAPHEQWDLTPVGHLVWRQDDWTVTLHRERDFVVATFRDPAREEGSDFRELVVTGRTASGAISELEYNPLIPSVIARMVRELIQPIHGA